MTYEKITRLHIDGIDYLTFTDMIELLERMMEYIPPEDDELLDKTSLLLNAVSEYFEKHITNEEVDE